MYPPAMGGTSSLRGATLDPGSKNRLMPGSARHFPSDTLFGRLGRAVCTAGCLPPSALFETVNLVGVNPHTYVLGAVTKSFAIPGAVPPLEELICVD